MIAYVSAKGRPSTARKIAAPHLKAGRREINLALPMRPAPELIQAAYDEAASRIGAELERGDDVAVLCEGDPFVYGSFAQLFDRLGESYPTEVVPGVVSFTAAAAAARSPLVRGTQNLLVLPATLSTDALAAHLAQADAAAILKLGRHLSKVRSCSSGSACCTARSMSSRRLTRVNGWCASSISTSMKRRTSR